MVLGCPNCSGGEKLHKTFAPCLFIMALFISGCTTSTSDAPLDKRGSTNNFDGKIQSSQQISKRLIGNTVIGRTNDFPQAGPLKVRFYFDPNGTIVDWVKFENTGKTNRDVGIWRIAKHKQGTICIRYKRRRGGKEKCAQVKMSNDGRYQSAPNRNNNITVTGKVVAGNQVN